jgi:Na+-driven multidrug efflux pump
MRAARRVADRLLVFGLLASSTLASSTWLMRGVLPTLFTSDAACHLACQPAMLPVCVMLALTWFKVRGMSLAASAPHHPGRLCTLGSTQPCRGSCMVVE